MKTMTVALLAVAITAVLAGPAAATPNRSVSLTGDQTAGWTSTGSGAYLAYPLLDCGGSTPVDYCDQTLLSTTNPFPAAGPAKLTITMTPSGTLADYDLYVYKADASGAPTGDPIDDGRDQTGLGAGEAESLVVPNASGRYIVEVTSFTVVQGTATVKATLDSPDSALG